MKWNLGIPNQTNKQTNKQTWDNLKQKRVLTGQQPPKKIPLASFARSAVALQTSRGEAEEQQLWGSQDRSEPLKAEAFWRQWILIHVQYINIIRAYVAFKSFKGLELWWSDCRTAIILFLFSVWRTTQTREWSEWSQVSWPLSVEQRSILRVLTRVLFLVLAAFQNKTIHNHTTLQVTWKPTQRLRCLWTHQTFP